MAYDAKILLDSISPDGVRLTTMEVTFPRIVLAEFNTHRQFSRNSASSRAIPVEKMLKRVQEDPFIPIWWGKNQKGMQAVEELDEAARAEAQHQWLVARDNAVRSVQHMALDLDVHKQIANRLLEPFLWHTVIVTATEWDNFFNLRCHKDAQPEIRKVAEMMRELYWYNSKQQHVYYNSWHLPLVDPREVDEWMTGDGADSSSAHATQFWKKVSAGRCARVSYLTHDGKRDPQADIDLCDRLVKSGHMSPLEHVARPMGHEETDAYYWAEKASGADVSATFSGNFRGWIQYRKEIPNEAVYQG